MCRAYCRCAAAAAALHQMLVECGPECVQEFSPKSLEMLLAGSDESTQIGSSGNKGRAKAFASSDGQLYSCGGACDTLAGDLILSKKLQANDLDRYRICSAGEMQACEKALLVLDACDLLLRD